MQCAKGSICLASFIGSFLPFINLLVSLCVALSVAVFFWGIVKYIYKSSDSGGKAEGRQLIVWGLIALTVLLSLTGIVNLLANGLLGTANTSGSPSGSFTQDSSSFTSSGSSFTPTYSGQVQNVQTNMFGSPVGPIQITTFDKTL